MSTSTPGAAFYHFHAPYNAPTDVPEPFGFIAPPSLLDASRGEPSALPESNNTFLHGSTTSRSDIFSPQNSTSSPKRPVYFNAIGGNIGLVCGRENETKYRILTSLLAGSIQSRNDVLCFTAENGSLDIVQNFTALLQGENGDPNQNGADVIVLTWPSNVSNLRALHASSNNTKVYPLLVHPEDVKLDHLRYLYQGRVWGSQNAVFDDLLQASRVRGALDLEEVTVANLRDKLNVNIPGWLRSSIGAQLYPGAFFFLDLNPYLSQQLDGPAPQGWSESRGLPGWIHWIHEGQPSTRSSPSSQSDAQSKPLLLCIDWTGCTPEEHRVQNVLADVVLRHWLSHHQSHGDEEHKLKAPTSIVCDNVHRYISDKDHSPFVRSLSRLSHESSLSSPTNSSGMANGSGSSSVATTRPANHSLILLTETPNDIPASLQDSANFLVLHHFTSPGWLTALEKHFHLHSCPSSPSAFRSLMDQVLELDDGHILLLSPPKPGVGLGVQNVSSRGAEAGVWQNAASNVTPTTTKANTNGVIQCPQKQSSLPTAVPVGRQLTMVCFSKGDHSHCKSVNFDANVPEKDGGIFGVIGGNYRRNGNDAGPATQAGLSSSSPYQSHAGVGVNGLKRSGVQGTMQALRGLSSSPSSSITRDRSPQMNGTGSYNQLSQRHSPAPPSHWQWRDERVNGTPCNPAASNGFRSFSSGTTTSLLSPPSSNASGYLQQQRSPPSPPYIPMNSSDAVIGRPIVVGVGVPRRISPPLSSSASGMSFSFGNGNTNGITPSSSSAANPSNISASFMSPTSPIGAGGRATAFSPFTAPSLLKEREGTFGFDGGYSTSDSSSRYHMGGSTNTMLVDTRPSLQFSSERHSRTDTTSTASRDDSSSADYVDVGAVGFSGDFSRVMGTKSPAPRVDNRVSSDLAAQAAGMSLGKRSYAGVAAPTRDSVTRRDTVVPPQENTRPALTTQGTSESDAAISGPSSTSDLLSPSSSDQPPPPTYPEPFFWPLLDALEKSRAQVSTPHNRAQSVRHSVVGQELPPSARARLGLTFKEYVAAAARQGVIVTGDSGDKAWIAMRDWKYPGKNFGSWSSR